MTLPQLINYKNSTQTWLKTVRESWNSDQIPIVVEGILSCEFTSASIRIHAVPSLRWRDYLSSYERVIMYCGNILIDMTKKL